MLQIASAALQVSVLVSELLDLALQHRMLFGREAQQYCPLQTLPLKQSKSELDCWHERSLQSPVPQRSPLVLLDLALQKINRKRR